MGRIKNYIFAVICLLVVSLSACEINSESSSSDDDKAKEVQTVREEKTGEKKGEKKGGIPQELRPSSEQTEEGQVSSDTMEIMGEDGNVQTFQSVQGGEQAASGNAEDSGASSSSGSSSSNSSKGIIEISFTIESANADGSVSYSAAMTLNEGATVYDALAASGISHSGKSYVSAIGGLNEGMFGSQSGWKYYVNGSEPNTSCVNYTLQDGDYVQWSYVRTL